jgi:hypothetical protein
MPSTHFRTAWSPAALEETGDHRLHPGTPAIHMAATHIDLFGTVPGLRQYSGQSPISAARRAFCLTFPVTQRDAVDRRNPEADLHTSPCD